MKNKVFFWVFCLLLGTACSAQVKKDSSPARIQTIEERFMTEAPVLIRIGTKDLTFQKQGQDYIAREGNFEAVLKIEKLTSVAGKRWMLSFTNKGQTPIDSVTIFPLYQLVKIDKDKYVDEPTARWFSGSQWRDGQYPPTAWVEHEQRFLTNNNCEAWDKSPLLEYSANCAHEYIPMLQFAIRSGDEKVGCTALFEWSGSWQASATFTRITAEQLSSPSDMLLKAGYNLVNMRIEPGESLEVPPVHLIYSHGETWEPFTHDIHRYILNEIAPVLKDAVSPLPVSYDTWFGLAEHFDLNELKREVDKAAELGIEYFTLDCGWSTPLWGSNVVDTTKFPNGIEELADYVRSKGIRFGLWSTLEHNYHLDFWKPEIQQYHLDNMEGWLKKYGIEWIRLEGAGYCNGKDGLKAHKAMQEEVYGKFIRQHPDFYIEGCMGGGRRLDLNMVRVTHGTWLSDHTGEPDVTRFNQLGALRVWPARFLNMAVETYRNTGDSIANGHNILSRMAAVLSFDGDIAQWSPEATARVKNYVDIYKATRIYKEQPVFFPFPQPRNDRDWDGVVYGDGTGEAQLLFVYRMNGPGEQLIRIPDGPGKWELLIDNGGAALKKTNNGYLVSLNRNSSALWIRKK
jgi:hypothetical protein